jgi:hypothetical protein
MMKPLTKKQATVITAVTGIMMFHNGKLFKEEVETKLGREVTFEEFATEEFQYMVKTMYIDDWWDLCYRESPLIVIP